MTKPITTAVSCSIFLCLFLSLADTVASLSIQRRFGSSRHKAHVHQHEQAAESSSRRQILSFFIVAVGSTGSALMLPERVRADTSSSSLQDLLPLLKEARNQLEPIPGLIKAEKWDSVRSVLMQPPLSDCWAKGGKMLLPKYAAAIGDAGGDELAALEAREEVITHLRFLDMAVYNNVFNPIGTEGTTGATKELVRSYYEDPINEYTASVAAMDELVQLGAQ